MSAGRRLRVVVEADGGSRGNPGPAGYGAVVRETATGEILAERSGSLGVATNNVAEYSGLIAGLSAAAELGAVDVDVRMDSKLVIEQMAGRWQIKHPGLRPLAAEAAALVRRFESVRFGWIPRERNKDADRLANVAMDAAAGKGAKPRPKAEPPPPVTTVESPAKAAVSWEPPSTRPTRLVLVRHGETAHTTQRRYSGRDDVPLTDHGAAQAARTAARVAAVATPVAAVVSSPLSRCVRTAEPIAAACAAAPVIVEPDLIECDFGDWEGRTYTEVRRRWPDEMDNWLGSTSVAPPGGESLNAVAGRTRRAVTGLLRAYPEQTVVVVTHVTPIKLILRDALAATDALLHRMYLDPAGISIVESWASGQVAVRAVNDTAHLD